MTDCAINGGAGEEAPAHPRRQRPRPQPRRRRPYPRQGVVGGAAGREDGTPAPSSRIMLRSSCPPSGPASCRRERPEMFPPYGSHINALRPLRGGGGFLSAVRSIYHIGIIGKYSLSSIPFGIRLPQHVIKTETRKFKRPQRPTCPCRTVLLSPARNGLIAVMLRRSETFIREPPICARGPACGASVVKRNR